MNLATINLISTTVDKRFPGFSTGDIEDTERIRLAMDESDRQRDAAHKAAEVAGTVAGMAASRIHRPYFASELAGEHTALLGQIGRAVGEALCFHLGIDPLTGERKGDGQPMICTLARQSTTVEHPWHTQQLECTTVVAAVYLTRQTLV